MEKDWALALHLDSTGAGCQPGRNPLLQAVAQVSLVLPGGFLEVVLLQRFSSLIRV